MAIEYAGGTRVNYTFTDAGTRADLVSKLETQLGTAGWSTISGAGTGDVLMKSAVTPDGLSIRVRLLDPGSGNCAQITIKNNAGTLTSSIYYLLPASVSWRIVANKYQFFMFKSGAGNRVAGRSAVMAGTIWVPSFVLSLMGADLDCGWINANGSSDTDSTSRDSLRANLTFTTGPISSSLFTSFILNSSSAAQSVHPWLNIPTANVNSSGVVGTAWQGNERMMVEAMVAWSPGSSATAPADWKGQLYDGMVVSGQAAGETTITFDGHTFIAITDQATADVRGIGTLYVAID